MGYVVVRTSGTPPTLAPQKNRAQKNILTQTRMAGE